jgi:hypothetical protein
MQAANVGLRLATAFCGGGDRYGLARPVETCGSCILEDYLTAARLIGDLLIVEPRALLDRLARSIM